MSEIQVPGQARRGEPNPLLVLATALDKANSYLHQIADNTKGEPKHLYALAQRPDDSWGSYCLACSEAVEEYVYPCAVFPERPTPPSHITAIDDLHQL